MLGNYDQALTLLLRQRLVDDGLSTQELDSYFHAHVHRGIRLLASRAKSLIELGEVFAG